MLHTTTPREGEFPWGGCYDVEADARSDVAAMRKATGLDWVVVPMVRADSLGQCLHQIAEPAAYPDLPPSVADVVDFMDGRPVDVDFAHPAPVGGTSLYSADQMRAYVDADRAKRAAPQAAQAAVPVAWMDPETLDVVHAERKTAWEQNFGIGGKGKAASYTTALYATPAHPAEGVPAAAALRDAENLLRKEAARLERMYGTSNWYGFCAEKAAHLEHIRVADAIAATPAAGAPAAQEGQEARQWLQVGDMEALARFAETTDDDQSYDIGKEAVKRLAHFGCVESKGFGCYSITSFGSYVLGDWARARELPFKTNEDRDAEHRAAIAAQAAQGGA
jgi:hypothetical protein